MGGVLPEIANPVTLQRVLDVGCGTGGWLMETARTYPTIAKLVGADISSDMLAYARAKAESLGLSERVRFQAMDALRILEFPDASFDLINQRLGISWLRIWDWKKILLEYYRVSRPDGIVRITECDNPESNTPAFTKLYDILRETFHRSGRFFTPTNNGITCELVRLMTQHGFQDVQARTQTLVLRAGTIDGQSFYDDTAHLFHVLLPFFQKWTRLPDNYQEIYQQALKEMQQPDFTATWTFLVVWGTKPKGGQRLLMRGLQ
jgi:ubiquinone/menaquinone biosynthesis C-methylase UbiE